MVLKVYGLNNPDIGAKYLPKFRSFNEFQALFAEDLVPLGEYTKALNYTGLRLADIST